MMDLYAVMMSHAGHGAGHIWIDSLWINQESAGVRRNDIQRMHESLKLDTRAWIVMVRLQDGTIEPGSEAV